MKIRVIKERWSGDDQPLLDDSKPHRPQLCNGGFVRVGGKSYMPGDVIEVSEGIGRDLLTNSPQSVELESDHQERMRRRKEREAARNNERFALDARQRELETEVAQSQKLRAMAEERERKLAADNSRITQAAQAKDGEVEQLRKLMAEQQAQHERQLAELRELMTKAAPVPVAAPVPAVEPAPAATTTAADSADGKSPRPAKKSGG